MVHMGRQYKNATHGKVYSHQLKTNKTICITEHLDRPVGDHTAADVQQQTVLQSVVWADDERFYFPVSTMGNVVLYEGNIDGEIKPAIVDEFNIFCFYVVDVIF